MADKITNIKERILQIPENKGISKESFFNKIGMTYGNFKGKSKETPINSNALVDIIAIYPDINLTWLLTGTGEMLTGNENPDHQETEKERLKNERLQRISQYSNSFVNEDATEYKRTISVEDYELLSKQLTEERERLKEAYKENGRLEWQLEQAKEAIVALKKSGASTGAPELKTK